jgi:NAD(P)-dependent dehydrogenase (short-subunit alcohol dehydrogenase family)
VAIVTGAGAGIGRGTARVLAERRARVVVADIDVERAANVAEKLRAVGAEAVWCGADVADERDVQAMVQAAVDTFGALHMLDNNAAITAAEHMSRDVDVARNCVDEVRRRPVRARRGARQRHYPNSDVTRGSIT